MATMGSYCKAYPISKFREYEKWSEKPVTESAPDTTEDIAQGSYLFLQENLTVTTGVFLDEEIVFDQITEEWRDFCHQQLKFEIPDFEREHNESLQAKKQSEMGDKQ